MNGVDHAVVSAAEARTVGPRPVDLPWRGLALATRQLRPERRAHQLARGRANSSRRTEAAGRRALVLLRPTRDVKDESAANTTVPDGHGDPVDHTQHST